MCQSKSQRFLKSGKNVNCHCETRRRLGPGWHPEQPGSRRKRWSCVGRLRQAFRRLSAWRGSPDEKANGILLQQRGGGRSQYRTPQCPIGENQIQGGALLSKTKSMSEQCATCLAAGSANRATDGKVEFAGKRNWRPSSRRALGWTPPSGNRQGAILIIDHPPENLDRRARRERRRVHYGAFLPVSCNVNLRRHRPKFL